jgi:hypothetical protein
MQRYDQTCVILPWPRAFAPFAGTLTVLGGEGFKSRSVPVSLVACSYEP